MKTPAPLQDRVLDTLRLHPGATPNEVYHHVRERVPAATYDGVRQVIRKLIARNKVRKGANAVTHLAPLYLTGVA